MAKTVTITGPFPTGASVICQQPASFVVTVASASTDAAVTLQSLVVNEATESDMILSQPVIQAPNSFPGVFPVLSAGGSLSYGFMAVFTSPTMPGISPNNPGGAAPGAKAQEADSSFAIQAQAMFSDGTVVAATLIVSDLSAVYPTPRPEGGETLFQQGNNSNLIAVIA